MWKTAMFVTVFGGAVLQWKTVSAGTVCSQMGCDFESNLCNWSSSKEDGYSLQWKREKWGWNGYAHLDVEEQGRGSKGQLISPRLDSQRGHSCQLQFRYVLVGSGCQLSVFLTTEDSTLPRQLWNTTQPAGHVTPISISFSDYQRASFSCSLETSYKIYFEGERLDGRTNACGSKAEIDLDDISCSATATTTATTHTTTPSTSGTTPAGTSTSVSTDGASPTAMPSSAAATTASSDVVSSTSASFASVSSDSSVNGSNKANQKGDKGQGLSIGAVAGIVIAMVLVIAFVITIVIFMIRRRQMKDKSASDSHIYINTGGVMEDRLTAVSNAAFQPSDTVYGSANLHHSPSNHYELAENSDTYNHLARGAQPTTTYDHSKGDKQATQDAYAVPHKQKAAKISATKTTATTTNHKPTAPDHNDVYNHLGNQNLPQPSDLDVDYSHLGEPSTPEALYSNVGQQSTRATPEYSLAKDVAVSSSLNQSSDVYEVAALPGDVNKAMMSSPADDYHHAMDVKGEKRTAGIADDLHNYDHVQDPAALNEDGYNSLGMGPAGSRDQQRNMAADDYSHV